MNLIQLMSHEAALINRMFQENHIRAKVDKSRSVCVETGYISYALHLAMDERFARVEALQRELSTVLGNARRRAQLPGDVQAIPVAYPRLALELPHPAPQPLLASNAVLTSAPPHTMVAGRSYIDGVKEERVVFDETPHLLVAGITGAGKSVLLQTLLLSLTAGTSPDECKLVLVDLKNEDLIPFERLPHTLTFAGTKPDALEALRFVQAEKDKRVDNRGYKPYRVVLVIDEMAQLAGNSEARSILGDLASIGRSKDINLMGATQHPTKEGGLGALLKANFGVRFVGQVAPGQSQYATNRPGTRADLLPGRGSFLRCEGPHVYRIQGFYIDEKGRGDVTTMAHRITRQWASTTEPSIYSTRVVEADRRPVEGQQPPVVRDEIEEMVRKIRPIWQPGMSKNAISLAAFDKAFAGTSWTAKVNAAIARLASTTEPSTTASTRSTHTSEREPIASSSRSDDKIIRLRRTVGGD